MVEQDALLNIRLTHTIPSIIPKYIDIGRISDMVLGRVYKKL